MLPFCGWDPDKPLRTVSSGNNKPQWQPGAQTVEHSDQASHPIPSCSSAVAAQTPVIHGAVLTHIARRDVHARCGLRTWLAFAPDSLLAALAGEVRRTVALKVIPGDNTVASIKTWPRLKGKSENSHGRDFPFSHYSWPIDGGT